MHRLIAIIFLVCCTSSLWANADGYWQCTVADNKNQQWQARNAYERVAHSKALEACKQESSMPLSCMPIKEACTYMGTRVNRPILGTSNGPLWRCTALDQTAKPWRGNIYPNRDDAYLGAKAYCHAHSTEPETCYVNFLTCKNLNSKWI